MTANVSLQRIPTYNTLLACCGAEFLDALSIAKIGVEAINKIGPFETGEFAVCDAIVMLGHLHDSGLVDLKVERQQLYADNYKQIFSYKLANKSREMQFELFVEQQPPILESLN